MSAASFLRAAFFWILASSVASLILGDGALAQKSDFQIESEQSTSTASTAYSPDLPLAPAGSNTHALNWAGYTATGGSYTSVSGSWIVPNIRDGVAGNVADATWVGIGGVVSSDLIQAGTEAIPDSNGNVAYRAWMETLPDDSKILPFPVSPGDAVSVSIIEESPGVWDVSFDDATSGKTYRTSVQYDSLLSSADWIEEMPVEVGGAIGLDDFGTVRFNAGYAIKNGEPVTIGASGAAPLVMDNSDGIAVAEPSVLSSDGTSFSVSRTQANSTPLSLSQDTVSTTVADPAQSALMANEPGDRAVGYSAHIRRGPGVYRIYMQF